MKLIKLNKPKYTVLQTATGKQVQYTKVIG